MMLKEKCSGSVLYPVTVLLWFLGALDRIKCQGNVKRSGLGYTFIRNFFKGYFVNVDF